ncbi:hypothetical protein TIFTF001_000629 [Ficus carica]|uniref:Uncharacterized protein n=1 Tax=Ficus carica TaxID=3494 RepID=A0AA87Z2U8_FICCA|nr:hypothetical protein TIFTF001_000629 [Ficus carica]
MTGSQTLQNHWRASLRPSLPWPPSPPPRRRSFASLEYDHIVNEFQFRPPPALEPDFTEKEAKKGRSGD